MEDLQQEAKNKIKFWVHKELKLDNQCIVLLSEVNHWKDCEQKETLIITMNNCDRGQAKVFKIKKCMSEVTESHIMNLLETGSAFDKECLNHSCSQLMTNLYERKLI